MRLEGILRELECEFLYLINDIQTDAATKAEFPELPLSQLEIARLCLSAAADALHTKRELVEPF